MRIGLKLLPLITAAATLIIGDSGAEQNPLKESGSNTITSVPRSMTYQAILRDSGGDPVADSVYNVTFRIFDTDTGGGFLWEQASPCTTSGGLFNATFNNVNLPFDVDYWLELEIGGEILDPRQKLSMTAYAAAADTADYARNASGSGWVDDGSIVRLDSDSDSVGIGTASPLEKLDIAGTAKMEGFSMPTGASEGYVLTSDSSGIGTWQIPSGGNSNWTVIDSVLYTNNNWGIARGNADNLLYGNNKYSMVNLGVACTTGLGSQYYESITISGGRYNRADRNYSTIGGGESNKIYSWHGTIGGGRNNAVNHIFGTVGGGEYNQTYWQYSTVGGGRYNLAHEWYTVVAGGVADTAMGQYNAICGGKQNYTNGLYSCISGGLENRASADYSRVGGGLANTVSGAYSVVLGGAINVVSSDFSMAFGQNVSVSDFRTVALFESTLSGKLGVNRDDDDGGIYNPIHVGTNTGNGNGAYLSWAGVWTNGSSRSFKENGRSVSGAALLDKISDLEIDHYNFINTNETHIGPYAEDFVAAFDVGEIRPGDNRRDDKYLAAGDVAGVALAGVKELIEENRELKSIIARLEDRITELENK